MKDHFRNPILRLCHMLAALAAVAIAAAGARAATPRWTEEQARDWQTKTGWLVGCNFLPSTAINQLEMFQADSFDLATLDRELAWARSLGFNSVRVYLQNLLWDQDPLGFLGRLDRFLAQRTAHPPGCRARRPNPECALGRRKGPWSDPSSGRPRAGGLPQPPRETVPMT